MSDPAANPIRVRKIGHVGLYCRDLDRMADFYTRVLGFQLSDTNEKGLVFLRFGATITASFSRACRQRIGKGSRGRRSSSRSRMEVADLDSLKRIRAVPARQGARARADQARRPRRQLHLRLRGPRGQPPAVLQRHGQIGWDGKSRPREQWRRFTLED